MDRILSDFWLVARVEYDHSGESVRVVPVEQFAGREQANYYAASVGLNGPDDYRVLHVSPDQTIDEVCQLLAETWHIL